MTDTDTRQVLEEAFKVIHPAPRPIRHAYQPDGSHWPGDGIGPYTEEYGAWSKALARFRRFLDAEAWTDAALMLIGPDRWLEFKGPRKYLNIPTPVPAAWSAHIAQWNHEGDVVGWGDTLAEAIAAACIKAKEQAALRAQEAGDA